MNLKTPARMYLDSAQLYFLRQRYGKDTKTSANSLLRLAVLEIVADQAKKESDAAIASIESVLEQTA